MTRISNIIFKSKPASILTFGIIFVALNALALEYSYFKLTYTIGATVDV